MVHSCVNISNIEVEVFFESKLVGLNRFKRVFSHDSAHYWIKWTALFPDHILIDIFVIGNKYFIHSFSYSSSDYIQSYTVLKSSIIYCEFA